MSHSWFNWFRKILVRYEKLNTTYLSLLHQAIAIIIYRKVGYFTDRILISNEYSLYHKHAGRIQRGSQ